MHAAATVQGKLVSMAQKTYAPTAGAAACCRMAFQFR